MSSAAVVIGALTVKRNEYGITGNKILKKYNYPY